MEDQLISFETAKLAKEKGFTYCTNKVYDTKRSIEFAILGSSVYNNNFRGFIVAPTQSLLQKWLREKYNIHIVVYSVILSKFRAKDKKLVWKYSIDPLYSEERGAINMKNFHSYEASLEAALQEVLKSI